MTHENDSVSSEPLTPAELKRARILIRDYDRAAWLGRIGTRAFLFLVALPGALWAGWQFLKDLTHK